MNLLLAVSLTLQWDPSPPEDNVALYNVHIGIMSMLAGNPSLVSYPVVAPATVFSAEVSYGQLYYFTVTAVNFDGLESGYSNEVQYTVALPTPAPSATPTPEDAPGGDAWGWWKKYLESLGIQP